MECFHVSVSVLVLVNTFNSSTWYLVKFGIGAVLYKYKQFHGKNFQFYSAKSIITKPQEYQLF